MATQDHSTDTYLSLNADEKRILDAEKTYMNEIYDVLNSTQFKSKLSSMFIELDRNKTKIIDDYNGINIINTPAERLVTYCIYDAFFKKKMAGDPLYTIVEFYPLPQCGDLGIVLNDVVLSIEVKTICRTSNSSDLGYLPFRRNQTSFENICDYAQADKSTGFNPKFRIKGNIEQFVGTKPMLTYVIELVYNFDKKNPVTSKCELFKGPRRDGISTINLFCVPNGYISRLFNNNIFQNVKDYKYYPEEGYYTPIKLDTKLYPNKQACIKDKAATYAYIRANHSMRVTSDWKVANNQDQIVFVDTSKIGNEFHESAGMLWVLLERKKSGVRQPQLQPIKAPSNCRIDWKSNLVERYDSNDVRWDGVRHITV